LPDIMVVTDPKTALGFRLAGVETVAVEDIHEAEKILSDLLKQKQAGVVVVNETFFNVLPEKLQKKLDESIQPIFAPIPHIQSWKEGEGREEYLGRLLRRMMGFQIRIHK